MSIASIVSILMGMLPLIFKTSKRLETLEAQIKTQKSLIINKRAAGSITYGSLWQFLEERESLLKTQRGIAHRRKVHISFLYLGVIFGGLGLLFPQVLPHISSLPFSCGCITCIVVNAIMVIIISFSRNVADIRSED